MEGSAAIQNDKFPVTALLGPHLNILGAATKFESDWLYVIELPVLGIVKVIV